MDRYPWPQQGAALISAVLDGHQLFQLAASFAGRRLTLQLDQNELGIRWQKRWVNVSHILATLPVGLEPLATGTWNLEPVLRTGAPRLVG